MSEPLQLQLAQSPYDADAESWLRRLDRTCPQVAETLRRMRRLMALKVLRMRTAAGSEQK